MEEEKGDMEEGEMVNDGEWTEVNHALPFWRETSTLLKSLNTTLMEPQKQFCGLLKKQKNELVSCACCWIWIPLNVLYIVFVCALLCLVATVAAVVGFFQSFIFLLIGVWPGFIMALDITGISIVRLPCNLYYHCYIAYKNYQRGDWIKAFSFFLLCPVQLLLPFIVAVVSLSAVGVSMVVAFFGCPQTPWKKIGSVHREAWQQIAVDIEQKVKNLNFDEGSENCSTPTWMFFEELCTSLPKLISVPLPLFHKISKIQDCGVGFVVITVFCPVWIPFVAVYFLIFAVMISVITVPFIIIGILQSLLHMFFGIWPGFIFPLYLTMFSIVRIPWNIYYHFVIIFKTIKLGQYIQSINYLLLLPTQVLIPVILGIGSLPAGILASAVISLLGCPQVPWRELGTVCKKANRILITDVANMANNFGIRSEESTNPDRSSNSEEDEENYAVPYWKGAGKALEMLSVGVMSPMSYTSQATKSIIRTVLCCPLWIPVGALYILISGLIFAIVIIPLAIIGLIQSIIYLILGIWPGILIGIGVTGISIIRIPWNIYYHILVTYRTVLLRRSLKVSSIILVPPTHFLVPVVIAVVSFGGCIPASAAVSFTGKPQKPWKKLPHLIRKFWKRYVTDVKAHVDNYGHESGIPENWDGRIYGLPLDPITIVMGILFYFYAIFPVTLGVIFLISIKALPIVIQGLVSYVQTMNFFKAAKKWAGKIGEFAQWNACGKFATILDDYFKLIKHLNPSEICVAITAYSKECNVGECVPKDGCEKFILSPCILIVSLFWIFGFGVVIIAMIFKIVLGFLAWILGWVFTILGPPTLYILSWFALLILLPVVYTIIWILGFIFTLLLPWPFLAISLLAGPFLALKVPYVVFKYNLLNPAGMDQSFKMGLRKPLEIIKDLDRTTGKFSFKKWTLWDHPDTDATDNLLVQKEIKYWDLFFERSTIEVSEIIKKNWLTSDDIAEASATAMVAIPGFTILSVLCESVKKEDKDKSLIYWNEGNQCSSRNRNGRDNISNHFFPLLMKLKCGLREPVDIDMSKAFIAASFCDGDDEKTKDLQEFLENQLVDETEKKKYLKIRAELENVVHSLLRVEKMQKLLSKICAYDYKTMPKIKLDSHHSYTESEDQV